MPSQLELQIREMDDPSKSATEVAEEISQKISLNKSTCVDYLLSKRRGFESRTYYLDHLAKRRGFESRIDYVKYRKEVNCKHPTAKFNNERMNYPPEFEGRLNRRQINFEKSREETDPSEFYEIEAPETDLIKNERAEYVSWLISNLDEREIRILSKRYELNGEEPKNFREIGKIENLTQEGIRKIQKKAILKLKKIARRDLLYPI